MQWAWTSMVLTRLPLTTTSRRPCACGCLPEPPPGPAAAPAVISHPTKAMLAGKSPLIGISVPSIDDSSGPSLLRLASGIPPVSGGRHKAVANSLAVLLQEPLKRVLPSVPIVVAAKAGTYHSAARASDKWVPPYAG